ncbi:MAG TPA: VWA domain-containing protein [Pyrinomonadaceae bacterium]
MSERAARPTLVKSSLCLLLLLAAHGAARAQGQPVEEPPRLKRDFGSSLERLRWDAERKRAVEVAPEGSGRGGGVEGDDDEVVRVETALVVCDVLVLDAKGRAVRGLKREDFLITEDGRPQEVGTFAPGDSANVPRSIVLVIDYSGSMLPFIENSVEAAKTLVDKMAPRDRMALVTDDVELLADFTRDKAVLKAKLEGLKRKATSKGGSPFTRFGRSRQYSALMATLREMFDEEDTRPIVIFQTDGDELASLRDSSVPIFEPPKPPRLSDEEWQAIRAGAWANRRQFSLADVLRTAEASRATVYTVIPGVRLIGLAPGEEPEKAKALRAALEKSMRPSGIKGADEFRKVSIEYTLRHTPPQQLALFGLSKLTGGWTDFIEEPAQAADVYARILSDINQRYVVGFYPTNKERDGKQRRRVQIEVSGHPEYTVWGRKSYYAPKP